MDSNNLENINNKLETVKIVMNDNIQFALQNTDKIDNIQQKSELLAELSKKFNGKAYLMKRKMCAKYWKHNVIVSSVVIVIILIIIIILQ